MEVVDLDGREMLLALGGGRRQQVLSQFEFNYNVSLANDACLDPATLGEYIPLLLRIKIYTHTALALNNDCITCSQQQPRSQESAIIRPKVP